MSGSNSKNQSWGVLGWGILYGFEKSDQLIARENWAKEEIAAEGKPRLPEKRVMQPFVSLNAVKPR